MNPNSTLRWFRFASPQTFFPLAGTIALWCAAAAALLALGGLYVGLVVAPTDAQQGEVYRIIFIHVPAAWMSMFIYVDDGRLGRQASRSTPALVHAGAGASRLPGRSSPSSRCGPGRCGAGRRGHLLGVGRASPRSSSCLPLPRLHGCTRRSTIRGAPTGPSALLAIVGAVNVPIIYYSVQWWNTLHQGASVSITRAPSMAATMLTGMLLMALAFWAYSIAAVLVRARCIIRERE
jgi:heme exporter protein C